MEEEFTSGSVCLQRKHLACVSLFFGKRLSRKSNNVIVFSLVFHIAVQQPFKIYTYPTPPPPKKSFTSRTQSLGISDM
jgi:hypothetical protein